MKESQLNQPELQLLEAQLTEMLPRLPLEQQTELLYRCAFTAGRHEGAQRASRWRAISAACSSRCQASRAPTTTGAFTSGGSVEEISDAVFE